MVEGGATHFSNVLLHGEMCVQSNAKITNRVRRRNGGLPKRKRNVGWFQPAGFGVADQRVGLLVVELDEVVRHPSLGFTNTVGDQGVGASLCGVVRNQRKGRVDLLVIGVEVVRDTVLQGDGMDWAVVESKEYGA
jgi:hypothetical protein